MATSPGWALFGTLAFCVIWNGIVAVFVVMAVRGHLAGQPDWFLTLFIIPFVLIGLGSHRRSSSGNCWWPPASGRP